MNKLVWLLILVWVITLFSAQAQTVPLLPDQTITTSQTAWDYESNGFFIAYFNEDPSAGYAVSFNKNGNEIQLLPHALNYNNDLSQLQQISMPQSVTGTPNDKTFLYQNAYGTGIDLQYTITPKKLKEELIINDFSNLPAIASYVEAGGNPVIELTFQIGTNAQHISIDGQDWDMDSDVSTSNPVLVKNDAGETIYTLPPPYAIDANNNNITGQYKFKKSAQKLMVHILIPYSFLETATYPVKIDPTFTVDYSPIPAEWLIGGFTNSTPDNQFISVSDITTGVSDSNDATYYEVFKLEQKYYTKQKHDGTVDNWDSMTTNNYVWATDLDLGTEPITAAKVCIVGGEQGVADGRLSIGTTIYPAYDFVFPTTTTPTTTTCVKINPSLLSAGTNRIGVGCYSGCTVTNRLYLGVDTTNPDFGSYWWNTASWSPHSTHDHMITVYINTTNNTQGKAISGHWNITYEDDYQYFLRVKKLGLNNANITVYSYENVTNINSLNVQQTINGFGWFNINVTNLVFYETNTTLLDYTELRFYTDLSNYFSEVQLRKELNDTIPPTINNYSTNTTNITCGQTARIIANVTDNSDVDEVIFTINGQNYTATKNGDLYFYDLFPLINGSIDYDFTDINACDILGNCLNQNTNITINYFCVGCNWEEQITDLTICRINNTITKLLTYTETAGCGTLDGLPLDNGTISEVYCNYCDPDWQELTGGLHECQSNSTRYVEYFDNNICYLITNLTEDEPPYDQETFVDCDFYTNNFNCSIASEPFLRKKIEYSCTLPVGDWKCINKVSFGFYDTLQVNPQKTERSNPIISLRTDEESRESFETQNGLLNAYFTNKNLVAETPFIITTTCSDGNNTLLHEQQITPTLKDLTDVPTIGIWVKDNAGYIIVIFLLLLVLIWLGGWLWSQRTSR